MKILVTGSTGFVGKHVSEVLSYEHTVFSLARSRYKFESLNVKGSIIEGNLNELIWINQLPHDLDVVVHVAGLVHSHNINAFKEVNVDCTEYLIRALEKRYKTLKFILISSQASVGPSDFINRSLDENDTPLPVSAYGISKLKQELVLKESKNNWKKIIIRPSIVIGPGDEAFIDIVKPLSKGIKMYSGKNGNKKKYSFVCIYDLVETIRLSLVNNSFSIETFFSAYPIPVTYEALLTEIELQLGIKGRTVYIPNSLLQIVAFFSTLFNLNIRLTQDKINEIKPKMWTCNSMKSQFELGQKYQWNLSKAIKITLEDFIKRGLLDKNTLSG